MLAAAVAVCALSFASADAAPMNPAAAASTNAAAGAGGVVEQVGWQRRRHCRRGHCSWRRVWVPGVSIYIGKGHRYRHHRHHRRHRH